MIFFFKNGNNVFAVDAKQDLDNTSIQALEWLFSGASRVDSASLEGIFIGPRREMITPWSTNAVEITQNMGLEGISRIEEFVAVKSEDATYDTMLKRIYKNGIGQDVFTVNKQAEKIIYIENIAEYNKQEGLALNANEIEYLESVAERIGRPLSDSEVFGFSQVNSEHCRHKIFNGEFVIDGQTMPDTLFGLIKKTTKENPGLVVSAYKDNCAFLQGPEVEQFAPASHNTSDYFEIKDFESVISVKAETHNFPTTVEPFNGAATGTGGEIRDRIA
ncbi:MAG: phosphoribosylformylglycinamidine synthase, partial [Rikenellaceae bacterium]